MKNPQWGDTVLAILIWAGAVTAVFVVCSSIVSFGAAQADEVARVGGPGGSLEAVVVEWDGGATTDVGHDVYVIETGGSLRGHAPVARFYGAHVNDRAWGVVCRWVSATTLLVEYDTTRKSDLKLPRSRVAGLDVIVQLVAGKTFPELEGNMLDRVSVHERPFTGWLWIWSFGAVASSTATLLLLRRFRDDRLPRRMQQPTEAPSGAGG